MKPLALGHVKEVMETEQNILVPLVPLDDRQTRMVATIIYDLNKLGHSKAEIEKFHKPSSELIKRNGLKIILDYVKENGRMIWNSTNPFDKEIKILKVR